MKPILYIITNWFVVTFFSVKGLDKFVSSVRFQLVVEQVCLKQPEKYRGMFIVIYICTGIVVVCAEEVKEREKVEEYF